MHRREKHYAHVCEDDLFLLPGHQDMSPSYEDFDDLDQTNEPPTSD